LAAARRILITATIRLHRVAYPDESFFLVQAGEFPGNAARLGVGRYAYPPHHVCAAHAIETGLPDDLNWYVGRRAKRLQIVMKIEIFALEACRPALRQIDKGYVKATSGEYP
jgi:hypothetical protein